MTKINKFIISIVLKSGFCYNKKKFFREILWKKTIYYSFDFDKVTEKQQQFLFAHEISHIALNLKSRCGNRDKKIWNKATDAVINSHLKNNGLELINGAIDMPGQ